MLVDCQLCAKGGKYINSSARPTEAVVYYTIAAQGNGCRDLPPPSPSGVAPYKKKKCLSRKG